MAAVPDDEPLIEDEVLFPPNNAGTSSNGYSENNSYPLSHPNHILQKLLALTLMCMIGLGSYFCYDNPAALQDYFIKDMELSTSQFVLLYSWYSWPNTILCFVGGFLMDRVFGIPLGTCIYALLVVIGQLIFAAGAYLNMFWLTIVGRFVFGVGGESLAVAQNSYAVVWFKGKELNMVFGFQLSVARAGSAINFLIMEPVYRYVSRYYSGYQCLGVALFIASLSCVLSLVSGMVLGIQDKHAERVLKRKNESEEPVRLTDVKYFPGTFWLVTFTIVFYYSAIFPFVALGKVFFERKFDLDPEEANIVNSLMFMIAVFLSPLMGLVIDKLGKNITFVFGSLLVTIIGHMLLAFTFISPWISMSVIGLAYSMMASALWPLIALVTPAHLLGTAYGAAQSFENLGLGIVQVIAGRIVDQYGYFLLEVYFIYCLWIALVLVLVIWAYDVGHTGYLNMRMKDRIAFDAAHGPQPPAEREKLLDPDKDSISDEERAMASGSSSDEELTTASMKFSKPTETLVDARE